MLFSDDADKTNKEQNSKKKAVVRKPRPTSDGLGKGWQLLFFRYSFLSICLYIIYNCSS